MATSTAKNSTRSTKKTTRKIDFSKTVESFKDYTREINDFVLEASENVVEATIERSEQWQDVSQKAIKGGLKLAAAQQDIVFDALKH